MPKTPDEIKKGLDCCTDGNIVCAGNCVFDDDVKLGYPDCVKLLMTNALVLIQQLQDDNAEKDEKIRQLEAQNAELSGKIGQLQAERDAAVKSLRGRCFECKHNKTSVCLICSKDKELKYWQWRGVQKEGGAEDGT